MRSPSADRAPERGAPRLLCRRSRRSARMRWRKMARHSVFCVPPLHINNCRNRVIVLNALNAEFVTLRVKLRMAGNVSRPKDFYTVFLCSNAIVSTWHERTESTSFTGRFVRLDPRLLLLSWSYAETYQSIFSFTVLIFPFITLGTNFEEISYSISSGTFLKTKAEGKAIAVLCFKYPI